MKQKTYILGVIVVLFVFAGAVMKANHIAGAGITITAGVILLIVLFLPLALINNYNTECKHMNAVLHAVIYITCLIVFASMLFKIMHWPGAAIILKVAIPFPFVVFLPVYLIVTSKIKNYNIYNTVFVLFLLVYLSVFSVLLVLTISADKIDQSLVLADSYRNTTAFVREGMSEPAGANVTDYQQQLTAAADQLLATIDNCREELYNSMNAPEDPSKISARSVKVLDSRTMGAKVLLDIDHHEPALQLEKSIQNFIQVLGGFPGGESLANTASETLLISKVDARGDSWRQRLFDDEFLSWVLVYLGSMETNVRLLKNEAMMLI
ncbi:MAG: hypothetical protein JXB19_10920 [Bacteroidales bacterium]|nr:hypothetical protein [Bacteroidales bacterium]